MHIHSDQDKNTSSTDDWGGRPAFNRNKRTQVIFGILLMAVGGMLIANMLGIFDWDIRRFIFTWQTLLIVLGLVFIANGESRGTGFILLFIGSFFLLPRFLSDLPDYWGSLFWPFLLILAGFLFIFGGGRGCPMSGKGPRPGGGHFSKDRRRADSKVQDGEDYVDYVDIFGGGDRIVSSQSFKGGRMTAIFGGSKIDFSRAIMAPGDHSLEVTYIFGGSKLIVPESWNVKLEVTSVFGGFSDKRVRSIIVSGKDSRLRITGVCLFGGGELTNYL